MQSDDISPDDLSLLLLLKGSADAERLAGEVEGGFDADRARQFLESDEQWALLQGFVTHVAPGVGWYLAAASSDERGRHNRDLLNRALSVRGADDDAEEAHYAVHRDGGLIELRPSWLDAHDDVPDVLATLKLPDGWATWDPGRLASPPAIRTATADAPWLPGLLTEQATADLRAGARTVETDPWEEPSPLGRYALGLWLQRWHPGARDRRFPFDEGLLRLELGTEAWLQETTLGSTAEASRLLQGTATHVVAAHHRIQAWSGWRRVLADDLLRHACDAFVSTQAHDDQLPIVRAVRQSLLAEDAQVEEAFPEDWLPAQPEPELATVAGEAAAGGGRATVDPLLVPARSVAPDMPNVSWLVEVGDERISIHVTVAAGNSPVESLRATVVADGQQVVVELPREGAEYRGQGTLPFLPEEVAVQVHGGEAPVSFRDQRSIRRTCAWIDAVTRSRRDTYEIVPALGEELLLDAARPYLAELAAWRPGL